MFRAIGVLFIVLGIVLNLSNTIKCQEFASVNTFNNSIIDHNYTRDKYPDCTEPSDIQLLKFSKDGIEFKWAGLNAPKNGIRYLVRYRYVIDKLTYPWNEKLITSGKSCEITNLKSNSTVEIELKKLCDGKAASYTLSSEWVSVIKAELTNDNKRSQERDAEECSFIKAVSAQRVSDTSYFINITTEAPEGNPFWRYMLRYKSCTSNPSYDTTFILTDTFTTINCSLEGLCEIQVRIIWAGAGGTEYESWCPWLDILLNGNNNPPQSPCSSGSRANPTNTNLLASANIGDVFYVSGLPFILTQVSKSNDTYSGQGILSFPFGDEDLNVGFQGISVNTDREVILGQVTGISSGSQPYNVSGSFNWGGHICLPKPNKEGWNSDGTWGATGLTTDPNGFDIDGKYKVLPPYDGYETGDPYDESYDPFGFDVNGINKFTGTKYGPNGCSREGVDSLGRQCDPSDGKGPYWWLNGGGFSAEGKKFYSDIKDSLEINLLVLIDELIGSFEDSLSITNDLCDDLRDTINTQITTLGYDPEFIKGANNEYFDPGLSRNFANRPLELITKTSRREGQEELEKAHVNLYQCDIDWTKYDDIIQLLNELKNDQGNLDDFLGELKKLIENFTKEQVELYQNEEEFINWLANQIEEKIKRDLSGSFGYIESSNGFDGVPDLSRKNIDLNDVISASTASLDPMNLSNFDLNKEIDFQLRQGNKEIFGIHKALIYEQISIQKNFLNPATLGGNNKMPLEFRKEIFGREEIIYFDNIRFKPDTGLMDVYFVLTIPTTGQKVVFEAKDVGIASGGLLSPTKLRLLNNLEIRVNNTTMLVIEGNNAGTFVEFDCHGLKEIGIQAYLEFCREFLTPLKPSTLLVDTDPSKRVKAHFGARMASWGQFMVNLSVDPFAITNANDIKWVIDTAILDFSDQASPGISFPSNYNSEFVDPLSNSPLPGWRGVTIQKLQATLPKKFSSSNSGDISVGAYDVIFDGMGFTGSVYANNVLDIDEGKIGGWAFSIDSMSVSFVKNELSGGSLAGQINIPIFTENMDYTASVHPNNSYEFKVNPGDTMTASLWLAKVNLSPSSSVSIREKDSEFEIKALLNGSLTVNGAIGGMNLKIPDIGFQNVGLSNRSPYFDPGVWTTTGAVGIKCGGFEITAKNIGLSKGAAGDTEVKLGMDVHIGLTDEGAGNIGADARFYIVGEYEEVNDKQKWKYQKIEISSVYINADIAGNHIEGGLSFYEEDPTYGTGFKGKLAAKFKGLAEVYVLGQFGQFPDYKYFLVDAMVLLDNPIGMGTMALYGLGGGLYYKMTRPTMASLQLANWNGQVPPTGQTPSGITYTPNKLYGFGFRATLALSSSVKEAYNCIVTFSMDFASTGGIQKIGLLGNGQFMAAPDIGALPSRTPGSAPNNAILSINVDITFDFDNNVFHGDLEVFANLINVVKGSGSNNRMAWANIHFGPGSWYIKVGSPRNPCGIIVTIPVIGEIGNVNAYLQIGTDIDDMVPLSERGFEGLNIKNVPSSGRNRGTGFAFGADLGFGFDEKTFLIFYAKLKIDLGFDLMIGKFPDVYCANTNSQIGINGWFAQGQAWANAEAAVGIKVKLWFIKCKFHIFDFSAGVALAAKLPNPFFAAGTIKGKYSILGGAIKGTCNFKFSTGELCDIVEADTGQTYLGIITGIVPDEGATEIDVIATPEAYLYLPIGKEVQDFDPDNPNNVRKYLVIVKSVSIKDKLNQEIPGKIILTDDGFTLKYKTFHYLPAFDTLTFSLTVDVYEDGAFYGSESRQTTFVTGAPVNDIPIANIDGAYPMVGMKYFYQKEYYNGKGYISLSFSQPEFFTGSNPGDLVVRFTSSNQNIEVPCTYDFGQAQIDFNIPNLNHNMDYTLKIIDKRGSNFKADKVLCTYNFHTSQYDYFREKVIQFVQNSYIVGEAKVGRDRTLISTNQEPFDAQEFELGGYITATLDLSNESAYSLSPMARLKSEDLSGCADCKNLDYLIKKALPPIDKVSLKSNELVFTLPYWLIDNFYLYRSKASTCKAKGGFFGSSSKCDIIKNLDKSLVQYTVPKGLINLSYNVHGFEEKLSNYYQTKSLQTSIIKINLKDKTVN